MNNKALLRVSLDHDDGVVRAQSWLKGKVTVIVHEPVPGGELTVEVVGREKVYRPHRSARELLKPTAGTHYEEACVFEETRLIHEFNKESLEPGTYCHPFSIYMPGYLPPTMTFQEDNNKLGQCSVEYTITAKLGEDIAQQDRKLTLVGAPLSNKMHPYTLEPTCLPLKTLAGVIDHGFIVVAAKVENKHVAKGREFDLALACRNKSREDIERVDVQVLEEIGWKVGGTEKKCEVKLLELEDVELTSVIKEREGQDGHEEMKVDGLMYSEMHADLCSARNVLHLAIPSSARDSFAGQLLNVSHSVKIDWYTKGMAHNPSITIPIKVFDASIEQVITHVRAMSNEQVEKVVTTTWPKDEEVLVHSHSHPDMSCPGIEEKQIVKE